MKILGKFYFDLNIPKNVLMSINGVCIYYKMNIRFKYNYQNQ